MENNINLTDNQFSNQIPDWNNVQKYENGYGDKTSSHLAMNQKYGDESLAKSLLRFLKINFKKSENYDEVLLYLNQYPKLINILNQVPNLFNQEFPNDSLEIRVLSRINEENKLMVLVHTGIDGFKSCEKIERIEDALYDDFDNTFTNILFSAEFLG